MLSMANMAARSHALVDLYLEGMFSPALAIYAEKGSRDKPSLVAEIGWQNNWVVSRLLVYDPKFKTRNGLGVGSTLAELRKTYRVKEIAQAEGDIFAVVEELKMSFSLDKQRLPKDYVKTGDPRLIPATTRVKAVLLY